MQIRTVACLLAIYAAGTATPLHAQIGSNETALIVGLVSSTLAGEDASNVSRKIGMMAELQLVHPFTQNIGFQTGLGVVQKGASLALGGATSGKSSLKLSYFEAPAMLRIGFAGRYSEVRPALFFGPIASLNVGCRYKVPTQNGGSVESDCEPDGPQIRAYDISIAGGGSVEFGRFGGFLRYDHGMVSIDGSDFADKVYNRAIILGVVWNTSSR